MTPPGLGSRTEDITLFSIDLASMEYLDVMRRLHAVLQPETYLEIGTRSGDSLRLAACVSIAIDPAFEISTDVLGTKPACHLFQETSDRFFRKRNVPAILGDKVELAFLDGMHLAEFLLRDFMNVEACCRQNSVILIHDCMPSDHYMACRSEGDHESRVRSMCSDWWTGDVWKAVWALGKYRPNLRIIAIDTPPTGLICVTNLDPSSSALAEQYDTISREMTELGDGREQLQPFLESLEMIKPAQLQTFDDIARYFYL